jgi:catechol 2,3-dioxygenase-like lactoylglutathione lyase family enzyme
MHLALAVRDEDASRRFFERYFGFEAAYRAEDGTLLMLAAE